MRSSSPALPVSVAEPSPIKEFWALGLERIEGTAETAVYNGGSPWAEYWTDTVAELRAPLIGSGHLDEGLIDTVLARCADPGWWTETISFTAVRARKISGEDAAAELTQAEGEEDGAEGDQYRVDDV